MFCRRESVSKLDLTNFANDSGYYLLKCNHYRPKRLKLQRKNAEIECVVLLLYLQHLPLDGSIGLQAAASSVFQIQQNHHCENIYLYIFIFSYTKEYVLLWSVIFPFFVVLNHFYTS